MLDFSVADSGSVTIVPYGASVVIDLGAGNVIVVYNATADAGFLGHIVW